MKDATYQAFVDEMGNIAAAQGQAVMANSLGRGVQHAWEKTAKDMPPFLKQDRPAKVKEIYSAIKREHPNMPAEMKARIASRQGKRGKQPQGPPYKGPVKPWHEKTSDFHLADQAGRLLARTSISCARDTHTESR